MQGNTKSGKTMLVIGATGGVGSAVARAFVGAGWQVRALARNVDAACHASAGWSRGILDVQWNQGDAMCEADVVRAAQGVDCIFHGANPPMYRRWRELAIPMLANAISAAGTNGARLVLPGNIYNYGPDAGPCLSEDSPQNPLTRKGRVRVEMEAMLKQATQQGVHSLVVRAGDFFGWQAPSSWFQSLMVRPHKPVRSVWFPGGRDVGHAWAYLPDLAQTILRLVELQATLAPFETFHFGGHWTARGVEMAEAIGRAAGNPRIPVRQLPWPLLTMAAPFVPVLREMIEMRYLWREPIRLDNRKLLGVLGTEPHTPLGEAVKTSLEHLGCLT